MKVSIIISNRNDAAVLVVTIRSFLEELKSIDCDGEIVICDNSYREFYADLHENIPWELVGDRVRIFRQEFPCLFSARERAAQEARGEYLLCLDSHMLAGRNMIRDLVDFMERNRHRPIGFAHAPISWCHLNSVAHSQGTEEKPIGTWHAQEETEAPITWKGMPWMCRREFFLNDLNGYGALSANRLAWGGGDMHIGIKPWLLGYENWAVLTSPGIHIGAFKGNLRKRWAYKFYRNSGRQEERLGFLVSGYVLGAESGMRWAGTDLGFNLDSEALRARVAGMAEEERRWLRPRQVMTLEEFWANRPWEVVDV